MTEQETSRDVSIPITKAVEAAGGPVKVAEAFCLKTAQMPAYVWPRKRNIPAAYIIRLCEMGGYAVSPSEILKDIADHTEREREAA